MNGQELLEQIVDKLFENRAYTDVKLVNALFRHGNQPGLARGYVHHGHTRLIPRLNLLFHQAPSKKTILVLKENTASGSQSRPHYPLALNLPGMFFGVSYSCPPIGELTMPIIHIAPCDSRGRVLENIFPNTGSNYEWRRLYKATENENEVARRFSDICTGSRWSSGRATFRLTDSQFNDPNKVLESILDGISKFWTSSFAYDSDYIRPEVIEFVKEVSGFDLITAGWRYSPGYPGKFAKILELASEYDFDWDAFPKSDPQIDLFTQDYIGDQRIVYRRDAVKRRIQKAIEDAKV